ncbi:MAG: hypothetical protein KAR05_08125 [Candidatus Omnitrophica bacterium]|nr:hypothetical protein [Candidatus Omnitrophota bacterium]
MAKAQFGYFFFAVAGGIAHLLFNLGWESKIDKIEPENKRKLFLGFT